MKVSYFTSRFFVPKLTKQFCQVCVAFLKSTNVTPHASKLLCGKHAAMISCANHVVPNPKVQ